MEGDFMSAQDKVRFLLTALGNQSLLGSGVIVIEEGSFPEVVRWPSATGPRSYLTLCKLDAINRGGGEPIWEGNVQLQLLKVGAPLTNLAFGCMMGGEYACFLSVPQEDSTGDSPAWLDKATKAIQETQGFFNLEQLQLLSRMQRENRAYTAVSNLMKTKHDTVKNSISNVR
jgi:hypothetical protein